MRAPPTFYVYHGSWGCHIIGVFCLVLAPIQRAWEPLAFGVGSLLVAIPFLVAGAVWRNSYNRTK